MTVGFSPPVRTRVLQPMLATCPVARCRSCALPSALSHSLTPKAWQHTLASGSAVPHPGGEQYTYETVHLTEKRPSESFYGE